MKKRLVIGLAIGLFAIGMASIANATITGYFWDGASAQSQNPALGAPGALSTASGSFTVSEINFDSRLGLNNSAYSTYQSFLQGGSSNINNLQWLTGASTYAGSNITTSTGVGTFFEFTGNAYFAANTVITHDDGFYLNLGGTIYNDSTPVTPTPTDLGNVAGNYNFTLYYGAYNGFPEVLAAPGINPVPEPATMLLFGAGIAGLAGIARRKRS